MVSFIREYLAKRFRTGKLPNIQDIDIGRTCKSLGPMRANAILRFHIFTDCDQTALFYKISKAEFYQIFGNADFEKSNTIRISRIGYCNIL